jgi:hypothetical protein
VRALIRGSLAPAAFVALAACGGGQSEPVVADIGIHRVRFVVPDGFAHYDHGREHRLERTEGDLVLTELGPATADGYRRVALEARELSRRGRAEDARDLLRDLGLWRAIPDEETRRELSQAVHTIATGSPATRVDGAFDTLLALIDALPPADLDVLADAALDELDHGPRRDIERREKLRVGGREGRRILTWQRLTHDSRRRHVFVVNRGHLLVIRSDVGRDEVLGPAFDELVRSFSFAPAEVVSEG